MKKIFLLVFLGLIAGTVFAKGDITLLNVDQYHDSKDVIRFKLVVKNTENQVVNELYSPAIPAASKAVILKDQLGITEGSIDYYIQNVSKKTGFTECLPGLGYYELYITTIGGWYKDQTHECIFMED
jgi:hypothetical protein